MASHRNVSHHCHRHRHPIPSHPTQSHVKASYRITMHRIAIAILPHPIQIIQPLPWYCNETHRIASHHCHRHPIPSHPSQFKPIPSVLVQISASLQLFCSSIPTQRALLLHVQKIDHQQHSTLYFHPLTLVSGNT